MLDCSSVILFTLGTTFPRITFTEVYQIVICVRLEGRNEAEALTLRWLLWVKGSERQMQRYQGVPVCFCFSLHHVQLSFPAAGLADQQQLQARYRHFAVNSEAAAVMSRQLSTDFCTCPFAVLLQQLEEPNFQLFLRALSIHLRQSCS